MKIQVILILSITCLILLILYLRKIDYFHRFKDDKIDHLKRRLIKVFPGLKEVDMYGSNKSFTINKETIYLCIKDENGSYYNDNMLTYVILHEYAHVLCDEIGHTDKFKEIFFDLLDRAEDHDLYNPDIPIILDYCEY